MTLADFKKKAAKIPDTPGVYFFLQKVVGKAKTSAADVRPTGLRGRYRVLYIGKATSLRDRVRSYFSGDLAASRGSMITSMVQKAHTIDWRGTDSVLEALILEANLIHTHKPPHNTELKDDKSFNYVVITREDFPRVLVVRGRELETFRNGKTSETAQKKFLLWRDERAPNSFAKTFSAPQYQHIFGPFPHGSQLKEAMRIIRKVFSYRDTCIPCLNTKDRPRFYRGRSFVRCKPCFNRHIGLCPGVCSGETSKTEYYKIIRRIVLLFRGKKKELLKSLQRDMQRAAKTERFEEAAALRRQVFALQHIQDVSLIKDEYRSWTSDVRGTSDVPHSRMEAYDVAHLQGSAAVGVMVVVENGEAQKREYRLFKINKTKAGDDVGALREILSRRLAHDEWPLPRLIVVDGSTGQINAARKVLAEYTMHIPVVGVVKDENHRPRSIVGDTSQPSGGSLRINEKDILLANAEAHRFAISHHRRALRARLTR